jgi:hypothetical protein
MTGRKPYRSDLSDAERAVIEPELTAWRAPHLERKASSTRTDASRSTHPDVHPN